MIYKLVVPDQIEEVKEVRVLEWHLGEGDWLAPDSLVLELETHKAVVEVFAKQRALLRKVLVADGDWQRIGEPLAVLSDGADEAVPEDVDGARDLATVYEVV